MAGVKEQQPASSASNDGAPIWTGKSILRLSLHRRAPLATRLDFLPFIFSYLALAYYVWAFAISQFASIALLVTLVILHILSFLMQHWSVRIKVFMSWITVTTVDEKRVEGDEIFALLQPREHRGKTLLAPLKIDDSKRIYFEFQKRTYEYNAQLNVFEKVAYPTKLPIEQYMIAARTTNGLSGDVILHTMRRFGSNRLEMPAPTFAELYKESLLAPFFIFQVFCIFLWLLDEYWRYSLLTLVMMLIFEATVVSGRLRSLRELRGMRNPTLDINVYRNKKWMSITSLDLLPGDIVSVARGKDASHVVPCDLLILSGNAVVNEAMLTGESVPLMKEAINPTSDVDKQETLSVKKAHKNHILFGGTRVLTHTPATVSSSTPPTRAPDNGCICYVLRTGFGSSQGKLMRTILYSTESVSANSSEAAFFILFLLIFAIAASGYVLYHRYTEDADARYKLLLRCVLIITSVVPPELPMQLALAVNTSLIALVRSMIFCTEPFRIPYAGKIDICCFDKTGTLTTDSINAVGVVLPAEGGEIVASKPEEEFSLVPVADASMNAALVLAGCHSLVYVDNELIGDPLELAALESVKWSYGKTGVCVPKRGGMSRAAGKILQRYRFASALQRMSVIAEVSGDDVSNGPRALVKGSPEAIGKLLKDDIPPEGYLETARSLARGGMRVLALAYKDLDPEMTASQASKLSREEAESDLVFAGFVCFECPLRGDSRKVIRMLRKSNHMVCMITGDATLTAAHVATQVGMCSKSILILDNSEVNPGTLEWFSANSGKRKKRFAVETIKKLAEDFDLCVAGPALQSAMMSDDNMKKSLQYIKIFARMSPDQKEHILTALKENGLHTLMCGDGTNDVGALKQAHVGVALLSAINITPPDAQQRDATARSQVMGNSQGARPQPSNLRQRKKGKASSSNTVAGTENESAVPKSARELQNQELAKKMEELRDSLGESDDQPPLVKLGDASIASPFTSRRMTIDACASIIRQGRCTLATTLQMYQILALNCLISAYTLSVLYLQGVSVGDRQMTITGLVLTVASFMVSRSKPLKKLSPQQPAGSIFAPHLFISLLAQFAVHVAAMMLCSHYVQPYLAEDHVPKIDEDFSPNILNTVLFLISVAQQVSVYVLNYKGRPYMQGIWDNKPLIYSLVFASGMLLVCTAEVSRELNEFMELASWPSTDLQIKVTGVIAFNLVGTFIADRLATLLFAPRIKIVD